MRSPGPDIQQASDDVLAAVARGEKVYVEGPVGSGRNSLAHRLRAECNAVLLELLPLGEVDAPAAAFVELASELPPADRPRMTRGGDDEYHALATTIGERLADAKRLVVVRLPASWGSMTERSSGPNTSTLDARAWFEGLAAVKAPLVVVADAAVYPKELGLHRWQIVRLPEHRVPLAALEGSAWGEYAAAFAALRDAVASSRGESPLVWRLAVGVVALGGAPTRAAALLDAAPPMRMLAEELGRLVAANGQLAESVRVALAIRRPMDAARLVSIVAPPQGHASLFTECIGYGAGAVRISGPVRAALLDALGNVDPPKRTHNDLAAHYRSLDGAPSPWALGSDGVRAWSEKVHHVARSGDEGAAEWEAQELVAPEQYWERARALSFAKRYREAAGLYARCVESFPSDDYAWHYRGWNLQRARGPRDVIERSYRKAVELAPENPWWNSRLVTFLIEDGQPGRARREWLDAIARVDADGEDLERSPWLALHMHRWVSKAWLDAGRAAAAAAVLSTVPTRHLDGDERLRDAARQADAANPRTGREDPAWQEFLRDLPTRCEVAPTHADYVRSTWSWLREIGGAELPIPMAHHTADGGGVQLCWSYASVLLEVEVDAEGDVSWFGLDRVASSSESGEGREGADALRPWLQRVIDG